MEKHKSKFEAWFKEKGVGMRPPIKYHLGNKKWEWVGE